MNEIRDDIADLVTAAEQHQFAELAKVCVRWFSRA